MHVSCTFFIAPLPTATVTHGLAATDVLFYGFHVGFLLLYSPQLRFPFQVTLWLLLGIPFLYYFKSPP